MLFCTFSGPWTWEFLVLLSCGRRYHLQLYEMFQDDCRCLLGGRLKWDDNVAGMQAFQWMLADADYVSDDGP